MLATNSVRSEAMLLSCIDIWSCRLRTRSKWRSISARISGLMSGFVGVALMAFAAKEERNVRTSFERRCSSASAARAALSDFSSA